jgi:hypothetical protein
VHAHASTIITAFAGRGLVVGLRSAWHSSSRLLELLRLRPSRHCTRPKASYARSVPRLRPKALYARSDAARSARAAASASSIWCT